MPKFLAAPERRAAVAPFIPFLTFAACGLTLLTASRVVLLLAFADRVGVARELPVLFLTGLRFDTLTLSYLMIPAWVVACFAPPRIGGATKSGLGGYFVGALTLLGLLECATWPSLREFGSRPEALFLEFLGHPREVLGMILHGFWIELLAGILAVSLIGWSARRVLRASFAIPWPRWRWRVVIFPIGGAMLFLGARSSLQHRPANLSSAAFSKNHFHNEAALNSTYTLLYALYRRKHESDPRQDYGSLPPTRVLEIVQRVSGLAPKDFNQPLDLPTWHRQAPVRPHQDRRPNVVVILLESLGAEYTGRWGGTRLTPNLDRLADEGIAFDRLFATGTRTSRGIEAVVSGFFPTPARSVLKLGLAQHDFFTAAALFRSAGYSTHFIYGGAANFDEMKAFFLGNGVEHVWDQAVLQKPKHAVGVWGIHDEDLFAEADEIFREQSDRPFFAVLLSTSNHTPFDYPQDRIDLDPAFPAKSAENAIKYTDFALGRFFLRARTAPYFANTLFLIVADHGSRVSGDQLIPVYKFHIPGMIVGGPDLVRPGRIRALASQVDLMPTLLALTGRAWQHPMMGRNLLALSPEEQADPNSGRALLQYETHFGYWRGSTVVILRPELSPVQFGIQQAQPSGASSFVLKPEPVNADFVEEALAHSLLPSMLYRSRQYRSSQGQYGEMKSEISAK